MSKTYSQSTRSLMIATALGGLVPGLTATPAQAQALQPVVDICTGVSLDDSLLTDVLNQTVVPTASAVESLFDSLLSVSILGIPVLTLPDVQLGIAPTTAAIASGDVVSLKVLDTNGNVVAPGSCNVTTDGYALNTPAGIAIGGNQITGLGAGTPASAAELDAIAFGNGAQALPGATGSIALGTNASVAAANGVSLGAGSTNTRGAQTGYTAFGLAAPANSVGTVSIGAPGAERQLTNVAPGTAPTDAATVGQVQGALAATLQYDDVSRTLVTLDGAGGTRVTNVAAGTLAPASTDAVNGGQLYATNQQVAANSGSITTLQGQVGTHTTDIATLQGQVGTHTTDIAVLQGQVGTHTTDIAALQGQVSTNTTNIAGNTTSITTLQGQVGTNTTDIAGLQGQVTTNTADIAGNTTSITNLQGQVGTNTSDIAGLQGQVSTITSDITGLQGQVGANTTGIAGLQGQVGANTTDIAGLQGQVTTNTSGIAGLQGQVSTNTGNIATAQAGVAANAAGIAALDSSAVQYDDPSHAAVTLNGAGGTRLTGLAQGTVDATSSDAVTGAQLYATNQAIAAATGTPGLALTYDDPTLATATLGGAAGTTLDNVADGNLAAGSMQAVNGGQLHATNQQVGTNTANITLAYSRLDGLDASVTTIDNRVTANTTQLAAVQAQVGNVPVGYVSDADGTTPSAVPTGTAAFRSASGGATRVTNVADAGLSATSTDAVNGGQLYATNQQVAANRTDIDRNTADIAAINTSLVGSTVAAVQYSDPGNPTVGNGGTLTQDVTFVGADAAQPVRVHNVAAATASTDAVNLGQLQSSMTQVQGQIAQGYADSKAYTDMRVAEIGFDLNHLRDDAFAGTAAAMAMASIPQTMNAGESMVGGSVGHYRGQTAFGFGLSTTAGDRVVLKASGTVDTHGKGGVAAGAGIAF